MHMNYMMAMVLIMTEGTTYRHKYYTHNYKFKQTNIILRLS